MWLVISMAKFLSDYGTEEDVAILIPMLEHPNEGIRVLGARYLGQSGGRRALEALEEAKSRGGDEKFLQEIDKAIANIESRLAGDGAGGQIPAVP